MSGNKGAVERLLPVVADFYAREGNSAGGLLHVVLDDGNVEKSHVQLCIDEALKKDDVAAVFLGGRLLRLSKSQRKRLVRWYHDDRPFPDFQYRSRSYYLPPGPPALGVRLVRTDDLRAEVFVDSVKGDDEAGDGSKEKPFRTIQQAVQSRIDATGSRVTSFTVGGLELLMPRSGEVGYLVDPS